MKKKSKTVPEIFVLPLIPVRFVTFPAAVTMFGPVIFLSAKTAATVFRWIRSRLNPTDAIRGRFLIKTRRLIGTFPLKSSS